MKTKNQFSSLLGLTHSKFEHLDENSLLIRGGGGAASNSSGSNSQCSSLRVCCTMPPATPVKKETK